MNSTGQILKRLRGNTSREVVAGAVGISVSALGMYEQGRRIPRDEVKVRLARFFGVGVETIFFTANAHNKCSCSGGVKPLEKE